MIWIRKSITATICACALWLCYAVSAQTLQDIWIRGLALRLEANDIRNDLPPSKDRNWQGIATNQACSSDTLYSALVVILRKLDQQNVIENHQEWVLGMSSGETFLEHMVSCLPSDGNAWLRLAMVTHSIAEDSSRICTLIRKSHSLAPNEALVMSARMRLYNRLSDRTLEMCRDVVSEDVRTILGYGRKVNFEKIAIEMKPEIRVIARSEFKQLPKKQKRWARREFSLFFDIDATAK